MGDVLTGLLVGGVGAMSERSFSHVCSACRSPTLVSAAGKSVVNFMVLSGSAILGGVLVFYLWQLQDFAQRYNSNPIIWVLLGVAVGAGGAYAFLAHMIRKRGRTCPACHSDKLIPVTSPEGLRVMKELGFTES